MIISCNVRGICLRSSLHVQASSEFTHRGFASTPFVYSVDGAASVQVSLVNERGYGVFSPHWSHSRPEKGIPNPPNCARCKLPWQTPSFHNPLSALLSLPSLPPVSTHLRDDIQPLHTRETKGAKVDGRREKAYTAME